jgi:hypothetical protein
LVEKESGFKIGTGERVFDGADAIAQVEAPGALFGRGKQAFEASSKVGALGDVRFAGGIGGAEQENSGRGGDGGEKLGIPLRKKIYALHQHKVIVEGDWGSQKLEVRLQK